MKDTRGSRVLILGQGDRRCEDLVLNLQVAGFEVATVDLEHADSDDGLEEALDRCFEVIIFFYERRAVVLGRLLSSVRSRMSQNHEAGVIVLADRLLEDDARRLIGRGVNRVLGLDSSYEDLLSAIEEISAVAPRVKFRTSVELEITLPQRVLQALGQTENVSESGMLIRGFHNYPPGTEFRFRLQIPGKNLAIQGRAEITRQTDLSRERIKGFGARFTDLDSSSRDILEETLNAVIRESAAIN